MPPRAQNDGLESLTIEFAHSRYGGHLKEAGYNAIHLNMAYNSWIRDVVRFDQEGFGPDADRRGCMERCTRRKGALKLDRAVPSEPPEEGECTTAS